MFLEESSHACPNVTMPLLDNDFIASLATLTPPGAQLKWYLGAIVALGALNYPEEIPTLYQRLLEHYIPETEQFDETRKIKEALTKVCGIQGAAKVKNRPSSRKHENHSDSS